MTGRAGCSAWPASAAGSSTALVRRLLGSAGFLRGGGLVRKAAGVLVDGMGAYFVVRPFLLA